MTQAAPRVLTDLTVAVAGQGGDGSLTVVALLGRILAGRGFHMYSARNVASRIKGGHAAAILRGSHTQRGGLNDSIDLLVAFDEEAVELIGPRLSADAIVIFDASAGPAPSQHMPEGVRVFDVPFARLAVRDLRRDLFKNSLSFGVLTRVLGVPDAEAIATLERRFARLPTAVREANVAALVNGFGFAEERGISEGDSPWELGSVEAEPRLDITGNHAIALGFIVAGGRFFTGYPITPATEILESLERHLPQFGGVVVQAEDELAAINMAIGAALTGVRTMTATSGPGISLMQEGVSHAGSAEVPMVIVDSQRAGPSTGMPTKPEQSDLGMLVHGGNGEFPRIVLTPADPTDCFELSIEATALASRLQCPIYIAIDQAVAQHAMTVAPFDLSVGVESGSRLTADQVAGLDEYRRYLVTEDGVSPWALPGTPGGESLVTGNEHNEWGQVDTAPVNRSLQMEKRMSKIAGVLDDLPRGRKWGDGSAAIGILGVGLEVAPMMEATERLAAQGIAMAGLQPRTLFPVLGETVEFVNSRQITYVVEHNHEGQLIEILAAAGASLDRMTGIRRTDGLIFTPGEIVERITEEVSR
jgi:2-oxoglutarate ferredoxin oxidoreductase subunit alpha